jgi:hypothetical protein
VRRRADALSTTSHRFQYATKQYRNENALDADLSEMVTQGWEPKFVTITLSRRIWGLLPSYNVFHVTYEWDAESDPRDGAE